MPGRLMLCSDLDRTLLPNGPQEESPEARPLLRRLAQRPDLVLAYVSGRNEALLREAIETCDLPLPHFAIGDVGTTIFAVDADTWRPWDAWTREIAGDWNGFRHDELARLLDDLETLERQEDARQNDFKLSYYGSSDLDVQPLLDEIHARLQSRGIRAGVIWSVDETGPTGLLDVLPARATKYHAIQFLLDHNGYDAQRTMFAGDSGNDLPVLTSGLQSVLVRNAQENVREEAVQGITTKGLRDRLYLANGGYLGMNGNYTAGVLEGFAHFFPEADTWLRSA